jgi:hypothetical protein
MVDTVAIKAERDARLADLAALKTPLKTFFDNTKAQAGADGQWKLKILDDTLAQAQTALDDGNRYCLGYMEARNSNAARGSSFDDAVFCIAKASILRQLDAMGIKPAGLSMGGSMSISSDITEAVNLREDGEHTGNVNWIAL